jgi:hypothetical protein
VQVILYYVITRVKDEAEAASRIRDLNLWSLIVPLASLVKK